MPENPDNTETISTPQITSVNVSNGNRAVVKVSSGSQTPDGYDFVIGTSSDFLKSKNYTLVKKNITGDSVSFTYIPKGKYYIAVHSYRLNEEGTKAFSEWSDVYPLTIVGTTPGTPKIQACQTGAGTLKLSYSKASNAYKYEYVISKSSFSSSTFSPSNRLKTLTNKSYGNVNLKNIPTGSYYFGVRAYTLLNGSTKVYSKWAVKRINIK